MATRALFPPRAVAALVWGTLSLRGSCSATPLRKNARVSFLAARATSKQPARCAPDGGVTCGGFGGGCGSDEGCVTDKCYEGKCGMGTRCKPYGQKCYFYAPHVCCTGECKPIDTRNDCLRLLGVSEMDAAKQGIAIDKQCENLGYCSMWADVKPPPGPKVTPWAVALDDHVSKYYNLPAVTFIPDARVDTSQYIARREGQTFENLDPVTEPGTVRDGGNLFFTSDSYVDKTLWAKFTQGINTYCIAPILRDGLGGAFYAVGKDCCNSEDGFTCGDPDSNDEKACVAISAEKTKYAYAVEALHARGDGRKFHGSEAGGGIDTDRPIFCRWVKDYLEEVKTKEPEDTFYLFKTLAKTTYCVAPIVSSSGLPSEVQYWAAGTDCCSPAGGFHCDDSEVVGAHSGKTDVDATGQFFHAVKVGEIKYGWKTVDHPLFVHWSKDTLVPPPDDSSRKVNIKYGKGVVGVTSNLPAR